jgi:hypothetical protein
MYHTGPGVYHTGPGPLGVYKIETDLGTSWKLDFHLQVML